MVTRQNPDGTVWKDENGKTMKVPGSSYRPTSDQERAGLQMATATYSYDLASVAAAKGDVKGYDTALWHANVALDAARSIQAHAVQADVTSKLKALDAGIEAATKLNDPATVLNLLIAKGLEIKRAIDDGNLDLEQVKSWQEKGEALANNPLFPTFESDIQGQPVYNRDGTRTQNGGLVDIKTGRLVPGTHFVLDTDSKGNADWHYDWEDPQTGTWGMNHITVQTGALGQRVVGEVRVEQAPTVEIRITTTDGTKKMIPYVKGVNYISYRDGYGNLVTGYSIDGQTWVQATGGTPPVLELNGAVTWDEAADGSVTVTDANKNVIFTSGPEGVGWEPGAGLDRAGQAGAIGWYGQANQAAYGVSREGVGAPGQQFRIVTALNGPNGPALNFVPREILYTEITSANAAARVTKVQKAGAAPGATLAEESAAIKARGLQGTPVVPLVGSDWVRQQRNDAAAKVRGQRDAEARTWDTRAEETNAIEARSSQSYINPATGFNLRPNPAVEGIVSIGSAIVNFISPPTWLPPVYVAPSSLTPRQTYVPPSSLTLTPVRTVTPPYVPPSSLTQPPKPKPPHVPPSSLTQPPKPKPPPTPAPTAGSPGRPGGGR
jgi:hypothetical protein